MKLTELFNSFQGEGSFTGWPMTFIRVAGCPVACSFCDTDYDQIAEERTIDQIIEQATLPHICITGGEPLVHPQINDLLEALLHKPGLRKIHIETSGCYELPSIVWTARPFFWITVSPKGSFLGAKKEFRESVLQDADEVKWLVPLTPEKLISKYKDLSGQQYLQPVNSKLSINEETLSYAEELSYKLNIPLSVQVHKFTNWR